MKFDNPQLRKKLVAEYLLGTMHGLARRRFERLLKENLELAKELDLWASHLNKLGHLSQAEQPPERVWTKIKNTIERPTPARKPKPYWWQLSTVALSISTLAFGLLFYAKPQRLPTPVFVSVIQNQQTQSAWLVSTDMNSNLIRVRSFAAQSLDTGKDFELWLIPRQKQPPISLGILSAEGELTLKLSTQLMQSLTRAAALAVSLEPRGGSPTGQPTGPVLYQGKLFSL